MKKRYHLRVMIGSMSLVWVATSEAHTWPIWISKDIMSSYSGGNARQKETKLGRVGMKKAYRLACVRTVGKRWDRMTCFPFRTNSYCVLCWENYALEDAAHSMLTAPTLLMSHHQDPHLPHPSTAVSTALSVLHLVLPNVSQQLCVQLRGTLSKL